MRGRPQRITRLPVPVNTHTLPRQYCSAAVSLHTETQYQGQSNALQWWWWTEAEAEQPGSQGAAGGGGGE